MAKWGLFGQMDCIWPNGWNLGKICSISAKWLYLGKVVVFGLNRFWGQNCTYLGKMGCVLAKWVVFGQMDSIWPKRL